jgi:hypothetical protein
LLPFSSPHVSVVEHIIFGVLVTIATLADPWMAARMRSLRTLPISSARLSSIPVGLGLVSASMLWIVLLVLHALVLRTLPSSLRPDLFIAFAALTAVAQTLRFAGPGQAVAKSTFAFLPIAVIWLAVEYFTDSADPWHAEHVQRAMLMGGVLTLALCWMLMRHAVVHSSRLYKAPSVAPAL